MKIIDISHPTKPYMAGSYFSPGTTYDIKISGEFAFLANGERGLQIIDISDPAHLRKVGDYDTQGNALGVAISGKHAYVADGGIGLKVIEIRNPYHPILVGTYDTTGNILGVAVSGRYVFVADGYSGVQIMRVIPTPCPSVKYIDPSTLQITVPAMLPAGFYDLVIKNPDGETARLPRCFQSFSLPRGAWPGSN
jgi:hypothetical protein